MRPTPVLRTLALAAWAALPLVAQVEPPVEELGTEASQEESTPALVPRIVAASPIADAGVVARGQKIEIEFAIENRGEGELLIKNVQPACGCTVASFDRRIAPGATGKIRALVDTGSLDGVIAKSLAVLSNDPETPQLVLTVKAEIRAHVRADPSYARFVHTQTLAPPTVGLTVWSPDDPEFRVLEAIPPVPFVTATVREATAAERVADASGPQWRVEVALAADAPVGPLRDFLIVRTSHAGQREIKIPLSGVVRPVLHVTPSAADFGDISLAGRVREKVLTLINFGSDSVEVRSIATDVSGLTTRVEEIEAGKRWRIHVELPSEPAKGKFEGKLRIETSSSTLPQLTVPVSGRVS